MAHSSTLLSDMIHARMTGRLGDLLLLFLDAGISYGAGLPLERPADKTIDALLTQTIARWHTQTDALRRQYEADPPLLFDDIPGWLLSLPNAGVHDGED